MVARGERIRGYGKGPYSGGTGRGKIVVRSRKPVAPSGRKAEPRRFTRTRAVIGE
jgi:hypothetical protein